MTGRRELITCGLSVFFFLLILSSVSAERLYTWGSSEDISLDVGTKTLHSFDGFDFRYSPKGYFDVWENGEHLGRFSFGLFGVVNGEQEKKLMSDFDWSWQIVENSPEKITLRANNNYAPFPWIMDLDVGKYEHLKITHTLENNTGSDATNLQMFYLVDVNQETNPSVFFEKNDGTIYAYDYSSQQHFTDAETDFSEYRNRIDFGAFQFFYYDIIENGFFITRAYFGNLSQLDASLPDTNGFALGFSKGSRTLPDGATIVIDPTIEPSGDNTDGYLSFQNGTTPGYSQSAIRSGHYGSSSYYWMHGVAEFTISGIGSVVDANLHFYYRESDVSGETCDFNLTSIEPTYSLGSTDWANEDYETVVANWFDETLVHDINTNITTAWNNSVGASRSRLTFRVGLLNQAAYTDLAPANCEIYFCDTTDYSGACSGSSTNPYLEYQLISYGTIDANISQVDGYDLNLAMPAFSYSRDGDLTIGFSAHDSNGSRDLYMSMWYGTTHGAKTTSIVADVNLSTDSAYGACDSNSKTDGMSCTWDWDISGVSDNNYWITIDVEDPNASGDTNTVSTERSFQIDNTKPSTSWDGNHDTWQTGDANITLTCVDAGTGCLQTAWRSDVNPLTATSWGDWNFSTSINIPTPGAGDGNYAVDFNSTDVAGNIGDSNIFYVLIDRSPPTTLHSHPANTWGGDVNVNFSCSDSGSGCANFYYSVDDSNSQAGWGDANFGINLTTDGNHEIWYWSGDSLDQNESAGLLYVAIDKTPPTTANNDFNNTWQNTDANIQFSCSDGTGIGCGNLYYSVDDVNYQQSWGDINIGVVINTDGNHEIWFWSGDTVDNNELLHVIYMAIDKAVPTLKATDYNNLWQNTDANILVECSDVNGGCKNLYYGIVGDANYQARFSPDLNIGIELSTDGNWHVWYWADDNTTGIADNNTTPAHTYLAIDKTAPTTDHNAGNNWDQNWFTSDANINFSCSDTSSGCKNFYYGIVGDANRQFGWGYSTPSDNNRGISITSDGNHLIFFWSDNNTQGVGDNNETATYLNIGLDKTKPVTTTARDGGSVTLSCSDTTSGCRLTKYNLDSSGWVEGDSFSTGEGTHTVQYYSFDKAWNQETAKTLTFTFTGGGGDEPSGGGGGVTVSETLDINYSFEQNTLLVKTKVNGQPIDVESLEVTLIYPEQETMTPEGQIVPSTKTVDYSNRMKPTATGEYKADLATEDLLKGRLIVINAIAGNLKTSLDIDLNGFKLAGEPSQPIPPLANLMENLMLWSAIPVTLGETELSFTFGIVAVVICVFGAVYYFDRKK